MIYHSLPEIQK